MALFWLSARTCGLPACFLAVCRQSAGGASPFSPVWLTRRCGSRLNGAVTIKGGTVVEAKAFDFA